MLTTNYLKKSNEEWRAPFLILKINVTAPFNQLLRDGRMPMIGRDVERRFPILLEINVAASFNQMLRGGSMPIVGRHKQRRGAILVLKINVAASVNQMLRDGSMALLGRHKSACAHPLTDDPCHSALQSAAS